MRKTVTIGSLGKIVTGKTPPKTNPNYYGDYAVWIKPTDISEESKYTRITEDGYSKLAADEYKSSMIPKGSICVPCIGTVGTKMTIAHCDCYTNQSINSIVCNEKYDNEYVYYLIKNFLPGLKSYNLGTASGREYVSKSSFEAIEIVAEQDLDTQRRISSILCAYDDLIENFQKQIKLLEEAAQRLYKEWFVDLRFPGHENVRVVDGIPTGWQQYTANELFVIKIGKTPPRAEKQWFTSPSAGMPWLSIADMKSMFASDVSEGLSNDAVSRFNVNVAPRGSLLLSFKLTVGRVAIAVKDMCTNEAIAHFHIPNEEWREYTYHYLRQFNFDSLGNTSSISKAINSSIVKDMPILKPDDNTIRRFHNQVSGYFDRIENLTDQIRLLTEARDRLLPKLMSGEIEVK